MGKSTGFLEYSREISEEITPLERIKNFNEFHIALPFEKQQLQGARCMECGVPFCQSGMIIGGAVSGCPLHNLIPEWNDLIYKGNLQQAYERLIKTNNFPEFTSRVCPSPCEVGCTCNIDSEPVSIKENEKLIIENAYEMGYVGVKEIPHRSNKKIAIIGSGPAGLAAADQLNKRGHNVTVFEREDRLGGLLMYGIPNMKLEKEVIIRKTELMESEGVDFRVNFPVDSKGKVGKLIKEYDAVILACGASSPRDIKVPGREANGIYFAVDFLKSTTKSLLNSNLKDKDFISTKGKKVIVVGGGDTGNDCVGTSIRHGAKSVVQIEMMPKLPNERAEDNPWPQWPRILKTDYGQQEAIAVFGEDPRVYETTIKEFISDENGNLTKVKLVKLKWNKEEKTGKFLMEEIKDSEYIIDVDIVLIAAGFLGSELAVTKAFGVECDNRNNVKTNLQSYKTSQNKIYTAGDMHRGQSLVVWAIREGREVAHEVDCDLMGYSNI